MKPESYREQDGCWNCKKVFQDRYHSIDGLWFCAATIKAMEQAKPWGTCDEWEKDDE